MFCRTRNLRRPQDEVNRISDVDTWAAAANCVYQRRQAAVRLFKDPLSARLIIDVEHESEEISVPDTDETKDTR